MIDYRFGFIDARERTIFERLRDWWLGGAGALVLTGTGTPQSVVTAPVGSIFLRTDGGASTTLYVKENGTGNTGWVAK